ncbi:MAG: threonine aldolase family protein [Deltaproteobacteria bacterium]
MRPIDLRSDTVTRPTPAMRRAMAEAEVGDDVFGEDPTVNRLEARVAELLGKEAALFVPTGTMANQAALAAQLAPGDEILCDEGAHCINYEGGALAALSGVSARALPGDRGLLSAAQVALALRPPSDSFPRTRLVEVEQTHNRGGGRVYTLPALRDIAETARAHGLAVHLDGARLWNACAASGVPARDFAACADSVSVCLSKGLGAPAGSLVAGSRELVRAARRVRKRLGGAMRQSGILAAAGLHALEHHLSRLSEDHDHAQSLAAGLADIPGLRVHPAEVETNLVFATLSKEGWDVPRAIAALREQGVLAGDGEHGRLRFVTHLDIAPAEIPEAVHRVARALAA